jgi:hypothetical protein
MRIILLIPRKDFIEAIEITEENISIRKFPNSHDLNQLKYTR